MGDRAGQGRGDHAVLDEHLRRLGDLGRPFAAALHGLEVGQRDRAGLQRRARAGSRSATASWTARLMPTPPTGDMACAASPMQSRPGAHQVRSRSTVTVSSLTSSQLVSASQRPAQRRRHRLDRAPERLQPLGLERLGAALLHHEAALEVVAARDQHEDAAGDDAAERHDVIVARLARQPHPEHVHRRADVLDCEARPLADRRVAPVGADDQRGGDLAVRRRASGRPRPSPARHRGSGPPLRPASSGGSSGTPWPSSTRKFRKSHCGISAMNFAARRQVAEVGGVDRCRRRPAPASRCTSLVRALQELVQQAELVHHLQRRRMHRVAAEIPQEIGVLLKHDTSTPARASR